VRKMRRVRSSVRNGMRRMRRVRRANAQTIYAPTWRALARAMGGPETLACLPEDGGLS
jgi:hypothetical protein